MDATGNQVPVAYRYNLARNETVSGFVPKTLDADMDLQSMRATQFGAVFKDRYHQIPKSNHATIAWEVGVWNTLFRLS